MRGSTLIPWLFMGPLLVAIFSNLAYQIFQVGWIANVAMVSTSFAALMLIIAAAPSMVLLARKPANDSKRTERNAQQSDEK